MKKHIVSLLFLSSFIFAQNQDMHDKNFICYQNEKFEQELIQELNKIRKFKNIYVQNEDIRKLNTNKIFDVQEFVVGGYNAN